MKKILICCLVCAALLLGYNWFQNNSKPSQTQVYDLTDYAYTELERNTIYQVEDMVVVDLFAEETSTSNGKTVAKTWYYLVLYWDRNEQPVAAMLAIDDDHSAYITLLLYANDDSQNIGDYLLDGYVKTRKNTSSKLTEYYNEALDKYGPILDTYLVTPEWMLEYHCNSLEDPLK